MNQSLNVLSSSLMGIALSASALAQTAAEIAPTGSLRAVINLGNPILARKDAQGAPVGVSVDLAQALANGPIRATIIFNQLATKATTSRRPANPPSQPIHDIRHDSS
jgi:ABC-type amino acid transport substrate-binding protein